MIGMIKNIFEHVVLATFEHEPLLHATRYATQLSCQNISVVVFASSSPCSGKPIFRRDLCRS